MTKQGIKDHIVITPTNYDDIQHWQDSLTSALQYSEELTNDERFWLGDILRKVNDAKSSNDKRIALGSQN